MTDLETLSVTVVAGRGARAEAEGQSGWAHLLEHMVFKGAGERSPRDIVESIEAAGGQINAATSYERTSFQVRALKGGLPLALEVLADLVLRPTIDAEELEREKLVIAQEIAEAVDAVGQGEIHAYGRRMLDAALVAGAVLGPKTALKAGDVFHRALFG